MAEQILHSQADRSLVNEGNPSRGRTNPGRSSGGQGARLSMKNKIETEFDIEGDPLGVFKEFYFKVTTNLGFDRDRARNVAEKAAVRTQALIDEIADEDKVFDFAEDKENIAKLMSEVLEEILKDQVM